MKAKAKSLWIWLCGIVAALCLITGIWAGTPKFEAFASGATPTVTMEAGASIRKTADEPGIKFTAKIDNYNSSYQYGMLILPESAWGKLGWNNDTDYIDYFNTNGISNYANKICSPYKDEQTGDWKISYSLKNIYGENYAMGFVGVAYTLKDGVYDYADVDMLTNARSIAYVAQMALKYEAGLTVAQKEALKNYTQAGVIVDKNEYMGEGTLGTGGATNVVQADYVARFDVDYVADGNSNETANSFVTKKAYTGGTKVSFKTYIPNDSAVGGWWSVCWTTNPGTVNIYAHTEGNGKALPLEKGSWQNVSFTLPNDSKSYYVYFAGAKGEWGKYGEEGEGYAYIDDFTIGSDTESFSANTNDWIFDINTSSAVSAYEYKKAEISFGASEMFGAYSAKIYVDKIKSDVGLATFVTKEAYEAGSAVSFKYYIPTDVNVGTWAKLCCVADPNNSDIYSNWILDLPISKGEWKEVSITLSSKGYLHFAADVGQWGNKEGYILIDDFTINGETETFDNGIKNSIFAVNIEGAVEEADGYVYVEKELAMKFIPNAGDAVSTITKEAYAAGSTVSFKYYIPAGTTTGWWGIAWHTDANSANNYHAAGIENAIGYKALGTTLGVWTDVSFTLPAGNDSYYLYFGGEVGTGKGNWMLNGENSYILIDDFTVNDVTDTFNGGFENGLFTVKDANRTMLSEDGEGYTGEVATPEELGEIAMKFFFNNGDDGVRARTTNAYAGGSTVEFKYYIQADTAVQWTRFIWDTDTSCNNYADTYTSFGNTAGEWVSWSYTLPSGGPYYLYFGFECGNWKDSSGAPYILFDNFTVNGEVETFNYGVENSAFIILQSNLAGNSAIGEGYVPQPLGAKLTIDLISSEANTPSFITAKAYTLTEETTVTFDYYMTGNTNNKWWTFNWTTSNTVANIYAFVESTATNDGVSLPSNQDSWQTATITVPAGTWYFYFAGAVGEWGEGYVIVDNIQIGDVVSEDFNNGLGIFLDNRSSKPNAITLVDGKPEASVEPDTPVEPDEPIVESDDAYAVENLLRDETKLQDVMANGGYASLISSVEISVEKLPSSMVFLEGSFQYTITGEKQFAISLGNNHFIAITANYVSLYNGTEKLGEIQFVSGETENTLYLALTAGGKVIVKLNNGEYVGLGQMAAAPTFIKLIALGGKGSVAFSSILIEWYKVMYELPENMPTYFSEETIDFTAYAFDSEAMISDAGFQLLADAGFTKTLALLRGRVNGLNYNSPSQAEVERLMVQVNADALAALELAEKYGMKHYVFNEPLYNLERQTAWYDWVDELKDSATYTLSQAFAGHYLADEPTHALSSITTTELEKLVTAYKKYKEAFPDSEAFINLLPNTSTQMLSDTTYKNYVKYYVDNIALDKDGVKGTGYVSFDHYPLEEEGITKTHLRNLELVAELCRDNNLELRAYIKASQSGDSGRNLRATESVNDLYFQIYSALAYGAKEVVYYQFTDHTKMDGTAGDAVISGTSLEKNDVYEWAKQANNEVLAFSSAYMNFTWNSASVFGKTSITQFNNLKSKASAYGYLSDVSSSSASVLVGNFDRNKNTAAQYGDNHAYMVVNYGNPGASTTASAIALTFNGTPKRVLVYENGTPRIESLSDNKLTLNLEVGEGVFVIPLT